VVGSGVGPFAERCLDEALGLTVGLGCVGPGSDVLEAQLLAGIPKGFGTVTGAVVGHDALDGHAQAFVVGDGGFEEGHGAFLALALEHLGEGDARSIVDADMDELPASAPVAAALAVAGDAVAYAIELAELLYVDVDQLAGMLALVAAHRLGGLQHLELVQAQPFENPAHGRRRDADLGRDRLAGQPLAAQHLDLLHGGLRCRSVQLVRPRAAVDQAANAFVRMTLDPLAHRPRANAYGVREGLRLLPACSLTRNPLSTARRCACILMYVHPVPLLEKVKSRNLIFPGRNRMDNLLKAHT